MGKMFICDPCNFTLHDYCGTCPSSLSSFMHRHPLRRLPQGAQGTCNHKGCDFQVHPLCTQLPEVLRHVQHPAHPLMLKKSNHRLVCADCTECVLVVCPQANQCGISSYSPPAPPHHLLQVHMLITGL
ncbi:hypothetical protein RJ639_031951 [Escallonia herrerae]|uniref:DC1 domain-containing protein n=1 Tax=Escallonia herrerae TaxID=1293975 RepID=A0AA89BI78_9ASTE|nr:hypothetical protein RJ639_031951 [Escallonia herrerae]